MVENINKKYKNYFLNDILKQVKESSNKVKKLSIPALISLNDKSADNVILNIIRENDGVRKDALNIISKKGNRFISGLRNCYKYFEEKNRKELLFDIIYTIGTINSLKSFEFLKEEFRKNSLKLLNNFSEKYSYKEHYEMQFIRAILDATIKNDIDDYSSIKDISIETVKIFLERSYSFILLSEKSKHHIKDQNLRTLFKKICEEELEESAYVSAKIYALINPQNIKSQSMLESISRFSTNNQLIRAQAFEAFENFAKSKYANVITILLDYSISDYDRINSLNKYLKKRKIDFNEVMHYWLSLNESESKKYRYKKLIAEKTIKKG